MQRYKDIKQNLPVHAIIYSNCFMKKRTVILILITLDRKKFVPNSLQYQLKTSHKYLKTVHRRFICHANNKLFIH